MPGHRDTSDTEYSHIHILEEYLIAFVSPDEDILTIIEDGVELIKEDVARLNNTTRMIIGTEEIARNDACPIPIESHHEDSILPAQASPSEVSNGLGTREFLINRYEHPLRRALLRRCPTVEYFIAFMAMKTEVKRSIYL